MPLAAPVIAAIITSAGATAGGYLASRNRGTQSGSTTPTTAPEYSPLQAMILRQTMDRLRAPIDTSGYEANGLANIGRAGRLAQTNLENTLTARGLNASPVAASGAATLEAERSGQVAQFQNSIPLLVDSLRQQRLNSAAGILSQGRGTTTTGTLTSDYGGGAGGAFTNLAAYLGYLQGKGVFGGQQGMYGTGGNGQMYQPGNENGWG